MKDIKLISSIKNVTTKDQHLLLSYQNSIEYLEDIQILIGHLRKAKNQEMETHFYFL